MKAIKPVMFGALVGGLLVILCSARASAQTTQPQFVYVNDNPTNLPNTVEGFSVDTSTGVLTPLPGSPFPTCSDHCTNNLGGGGGFLVSSQATIRAIHPGTFTTCLFVTNEGSSTFSILNLNAKTGMPYPTIMGPFLAAGHSNVSGMGAAVSPDGKFLYIANSGSNNISAYSIGAQCGVTVVPGSPFATLDGSVPDAMIISGGSLTLFVTEPYTFAVTSYSIGTNGALTPGSLTTTAGAAAGIDEDCLSGNIYVGDATLTNVMVEGFHRTGPTTLTPLAGSPYTFTFGSMNSNGVLADPTGKFLFVTNQAGATVTSLAIDQFNGRLTNIAGSPFADGNPANDEPSTLAIAPSGTNLFTGDRNMNGGAGIGSLLNNNGILTPAPGSPFPTAPNSVPQAVVAFPAKHVCHK